MAIALSRKGALQFGEEAHLDTVDRAVIERDAAPLMISAASCVRGIDQA
jgi:hypothetical protein